MKIVWHSLQKIEKCIALHASECECSRLLSWIIFIFSSISARRRWIGDEAMLREVVSPCPRHLHSNYTYFSNVLEMNTSRVSLNFRWGQLDVMMLYPATEIHCWRVSSMSHLLPLFQLLRYTITPCLDTKFEDGCQHQPN